MEEHANGLDQVIIDTLVKIAFSDTYLEVEEIAREFNISKPKAQYYLDELMENGYIERTMFDNTAYFLSKKGRKFLFEQGLL